MSALGASGSGASSSQRSQNRRGGPGSIFIHEVRNQLPFYSLLVDGNNLDVFKYVTLTDADRNVTDILHHVTLTRAGSLRIEPATSNSSSFPSAKLSIQRLRGDKTGLIRSYSGHRVSFGLDENGLAVIEKSITGTSNTTSNLARPFVNFVVESGGELILTRRFLVTGSGVPLNNDPESDQSLFGFSYFSAVSLLLDGRLTNVDHLRVGQNTFVGIGGQAHSAVMEKGKYVKIGQKGDFRFGTLDLYTGSTVRCSA